MSHSPENPHNGNPSSGPGGSDQNQPYGSPSYGGQTQPGQGPAPQYPGSQQQPSYAPQGPGQSGQPQRGSGEANFFAALFDVRFKNFITIKFASFLYIAGIVLLTLAWLVITVAAFTDSAAFGLLTLIIGFIVLVIYIVLFRLGLEFYVAMVRTAQNTSILVERGRS